MDLDGDGGVSIGINMLGMLRDLSLNRPRQPATCGLTMEKEHRAPRTKRPAKSLLGGRLSNHNAALDAASGES